MFLRYNTAGILWAIFIFFLCAIPGGAIPHYIWAELLSVDKIIHVLIFIVLAVLLLRGFKKQTQFYFLRNNSLNAVLIFCISYGGILELMQSYYFVDRSGSWFDFIANSAGSITGYFLFNYLGKKDFKILGYGIR